MSHLHIPDGVLPAWLVILGWLIAGVLLTLASRRLKADELRRLPLLGVVAAFMIVGMTAEIVPLGYHVNFTVIAGIVLGPALGFLAAFIVVLILALFGHGGITVVGLNTLTIGAEVVLGYYLFRGFWGLLRAHTRLPGLAGAGAVVISLLASTLLMIGIVGASAINPGGQAPHAVQSQKVSFQNPFGAGVLAFELGSAEENGEEQPPAMDLATFAKLMLGLGFVGWLMEAALTWLVVGYISRVRPDLVGVSVRQV